MNAQEGTGALGEGPRVSRMVGDSTEPSVVRPVGVEDIASEVVSEKVCEDLMEL